MGQSVKLSGKLLRPCLEKSSPRPMGQSRGYSLGEEAHVTNPDLLLNLAACLIGAAYLDVSRLWSTSVIAFQFRPKYPRVVRDMNWSNVDPARPCQTGQCCCILAQASQLFFLQRLTGNSSSQFTSLWTSRPKTTTSEWLLAHDGEYIQCLFNPKKWKTRKLWKVTRGADQFDNFDSCPRNPAFCCCCWRYRQIKS